MSDAGVGSAICPTPRDRPTPAKLAWGVAWLTEHAHGNLGTELAIRAAIDGADQWHVGILDQHGGSAGVSVWLPGGQWFLEADSETAALGLAALVGRGSETPTKLTTSAEVKESIRPWVIDHGWAIAREHDLLAMACTEPVVAGAGRWATPSDREALEEYQDLYNEERSTATAPDWAAVLSRRSVAVLDVDGRIVAVVKRNGYAGHYATIGGTWTRPECRGRGLATRLTAFITAALLQERPAVHLIVDDDNIAAIPLYRSVGFVEVGRCYMAYLRAPNALETRGSPE